MLVCIGVGGNFSRGSHWWIFPKVFLWGAKNGEIWFLPLEIKKKAFFAEIFKFLPLFGHPLVCRKSLCQTIKKYG